jgi:hypothetical protein
MIFWYALLAVIAGTTVAHVVLCRRRRLSILVIVPLALAQLAGVVLLLAGLLEWLVDPISAVGEYGDAGGEVLQVAVPLMLVGAVLLAAAWLPPATRRDRRRSP